MFSRATDTPQVSAANESWFQLREPIVYAGEAYYPAGAAVFFNGNEMVRTGHYNGVPVYMNATLDPYSIVYVPAGRGLMQPYERLRRGELAGSTGSRPPSFTTALLPNGPLPSMAAGAPTNLPLTGGAIGSFTPEVFAPAVAVAAPACSCAAPEATTAVAAALPEPFRFDGVAVLSARRPDNNDGLWVWYANATWVGRGVAEPYTSAFTKVGEHAGFPVYRKIETGDDVIFLPSRGGLMAPYRRKG
jgi:hypothetical protein